MPTIQGTATSDKVLNVSGLLIARTDIKTPLFNMIGSNPTVDHDEFILGAQYDVEDGHQQGVSETASLTAPEATFITRENTTNVTQIYQRSVDVSYKTQSNRGSLAGDPVTLAGQSNAISSTEFDWQLARKIEKVRDDIEYNILNSTYNKATNAGEVQTTRGLIEAITTNVVDAEGEELNANVLNKVVRAAASNSPFGADGMIFILNAEQLQQFTQNLINLYGQTPAVDRYAAGANVVKYITPFGTIGVMAHRYMPAGTAVGVHFSMLKNQWQPVPNKGAIFYEQLAKTGAAERGMLYAQHGLDYGHEWAHAKITGLAETTTTVPAG